MKQFIILVLSVFLIAACSNEEERDMEKILQNEQNVIDKRRAEREAEETTKIEKKSTEQILEEQDEILDKVSKYTINVEGEATESEISTGEYLKAEFMGDYNITFVADKKIFVLMPATQLELETIEMTITDRDTFAWDSFTSLMNTYSREITSTLGSQYQLALVSNIYGESTLLYRVKKGQSNYNYMKN